LKTSMNSPKTMNKTAVPCHYPWSSIYVSPNGDVRHCCSTNLKKLGNLSEQSLDEIWNGPIYQLVREHVAKGEYAEAFCSPTCEGLRNNKGYPWPKLTPGSASMEANEARARDNFFQGVGRVDHLPSQLKIEFTDVCNFRCVMCFYDFIPPYNKVPEEALDQIRDASKFASSVTLMGGEVFMNKHDLDFIRDFVPAEGASMGFVTNASYLDDKMVEMLKKFRRIGMQVSIDGTTKDVFEKIRVRGNWEVVDRNIRRAVAKARELAPEGYEWNLDLAYVVMKSNLPNLANSVNYAAELDLPIAFNPVKGFHLLTENIFVYGNLLDEIPDWRAHMQAAFDALESHKGSYSHYKSVKHYLENVQRYLDAPKISPSARTIRMMRRFIKTDKDMGHALGLYFDWKVEGVPLPVTVSYATRKLVSRYRSRTAARRSPPAVPRKAEVQAPAPELVSLTRRSEHR
jgi:MoaA/NifB/PqqE/SkfB family radical SAM enzyme